MVFLLGGQLAIDLLFGAGGQCGGAHLEVVARSAFHFDGAVVERNYMALGF